MKGEITYLGISTEFTSSSLEFYRNIKKNGKPATQVLFSGFDFTIPTDKNGLRFLEELLKIDEKFNDNNQPDPTPSEIFKPFTVKIYDEQGYTTRNIELIDAHIKNYKEAFASFQDYQGNTNKSMFIDIKVVSAIQRINGKALNVFRWHYSDYGVEEYQSPVQSIEEIKEPKIISGWWTKNKDDNQNLKKAKLGDTVYFHIQTRNIKDGEKLNCKLYDLDKFIWDYLSLDDDEFNEKEVHKEAIVKNNKAIIKLLLNKNWEQNLKEDDAYDIELYWKVNYRSTSENLPKKENLYLEVEFSDQTLFFQPAIAGEKLPQLISGKDGNPIFIVQLGNAIADKVGSDIKSEAKEELKRRIKKGINDKIDEAITNIALIKVSKDKLKNSIDKAYPYSYKSFKKETIVKTLEKPSEYVTKAGNKLTVLTALRKDPFFSIDKIEDTLTKLFDVAKFSMSSLEEITSEPINPPSFLLGRVVPKGALTGVTLWLEFLNYLALKEHNAQEAFINQIMQEKLKIAKNKGLEAVRTFLHTYETDYDLIAVSNKTLSKLLIGEFKTFQELENYQEKNTSSVKFYVLFKEVLNEYKSSNDYVIESIFTNN